MIERVLVTGANGFVGRSVCRKLVASGFIPVAGVRDSRQRSEIENAVSGLTEYALLGDLGAEPNLRELMAGVSVVIHAAARVHVMKESAVDPMQEFRKVNMRGTGAVAAAAAAAGVRRFIFVSTVKVHGESTPANPFAEDSTANPEDRYGLSKWEGEEALRAISARSGLEAVVVRPPLVYGPEVRGNFLRLIELVDRSLPLPWPQCSNRRSMIGVDNLADFLVRCVDHPGAAGHSFLVKDSEDLTTRELMARLARLLDRPLRLFPVPERLIRLAAKLAMKRDMVNKLWDSLVIDSSLAERLLDWAPPVTVDDGLAATTRWYRGSRGSVPRKTS